MWNYTAQAIDVQTLRFPLPRSHSSTGTGLAVDPVVVDG